MKNSRVMLNVAVTPDGVRVANVGGGARMCSGNFQVCIKTTDLNPEISIHDLDAHGHPVEYIAEGFSGLISSPEEIFKLVREGLLSTGC